MITETPVTEVAGPRRMLSLTETCQLFCAKHVLKITDVGDMPFRLLKPILSKLNYKQLLKLEKTSTELSNNSSQIWRNLIMKDFPERPIIDRNLKNIKSKSSAKIQDYRELYLRYLNDTDLMRQHAAERFRDMAEKLKLEKEKKCITTIPMDFSTQPVKKRRLSANNDSPILRKAKKDAERRSFMFSNTNKAAAQTIRSSIFPKKIVKAPASIPTAETTISERSTPRIIPSAEIPTAVQSEPNAPIKKKKPIKRKPESSIFIKKSTIKKSPTPSATSSFKNFNSKSCSNIYEISKFPTRVAIETNGTNRKTKCKDDGNSYKPIVLKSSIFSK